MSIGETTRISLIRTLRSSLVRHGEVLARTCPRALLRPLVDRVGEVYKTKRAAIIAGLRLLDSGETEQLRARVSASGQFQLGAVGLSVCAETVCCP